MRSLLFFIVVFAIAACGRSGASSRTGWDGRANGADSRISFVNPWFHLPKGKTHSIGISIDGKAVGHCHHDDRDKQKACVENHVIDPGWHVVSLNLNYRSDETLSLTQDYYHAEDRLLVGADEDIVYDLSQSNTEDQKKYVTRTNVAEGLSSCEKHLHAIAGAPTCTASEVRAIASRVTDAARKCDDLSNDEETRYARAFAQAATTLLGIAAERCLVPKDVKHLPRLLTATHAGERWWPSGTLKTGSWGWARDVLPPPPSARTPKLLTLGQQLGQMRDNLPKLVERLEMLEDFIVAYTNDRKPQAAIDAALRGPFDLDPATLAGHRLNLLLRGPLFARSSDDLPGYYDDRLADFIARGAVSSKLHCAVREETPLVLGYLYADKKLTKNEWAAVQALVQRTPADEHLVEACKHVVVENIAGEIPQADRLRWLATWDCGQTRHPRLRAEAVRFYLSSRTTEVAPDLRKKIRDELIACVGPDE